MADDVELVTVVVPTYNGARHLAATLRSLEAQTHPQLEVLVVDDGSDDDSVAIARSSGVVREVIAQPHLGVAVARNRGLAHARGRWVGFVDQDDLWREDRVASLVRNARELGAAAIASRERAFAHESDRAALAAVGDGRETWPTVWIEEGGEDALVASPAASAAEPTVEHIDVRRLRQGAAMLTTTVLYDRETAIAAGGFAPHARALDDHILNLNVARISGPIPRLSTEDVLYRVHPSSTSTVSPMVGPFLSSMAAVRLGGAFPSDMEVGSNIEHLLFGLADAPLPTADKLAILLQAAPPGTRARWAARWLRRALRRRSHRSRGA